MVRDLPDVSDDPDFPVTGLFDTSVFIAQELGRPLRSDKLPTLCVTSVVTAAELEAGIHAASDVDTRMRRLLTYQAVMRYQLLPIDGQVTHQWAAIRASVAQAGRRANVNDMWIAAIALANQLPVVTQDEDFDVLKEVCGLKVIRV